MIDFKKDEEFNLKQIELADAKSDVDGLLIDGEMAEMAFQHETISELLLFTNMRIIFINTLETGEKQKSFLSIPYSKVQYFEIQTWNFSEIFPNPMLIMTFTNSSSVRFKFKGNVDIRPITKMISKYALR